MDDEQPVITIYKPQKQGNRWVARADIQARGELVQLQATASDSLASRTKQLYNRAAEWLSQYMRYEPMPASFGQRRPSGPDYSKYVSAQAGPSTGVFADLPLLSYQLATARTIIPYDEDVRQAVHKLRRADAGDPAALQELDIIIQKAQQGDADAKDARETIELVVDAVRQPEAIDMPAVFHDAARGDPKAHKTLAALKEVSPCEQPTRLTWCMDDYQHHQLEELVAEVCCACADEIGARIAEPWLSTVYSPAIFGASVAGRSGGYGGEVPASMRHGRVRVVRPGADARMTEAYHAILAGA